MQLKEQQPSMNVDQQIENLKMIGLRIVNEEYADPVGQIDFLTGQVCPSS